MTRISTTPPSVRLANSLLMRHAPQKPDMDSPNAMALDADDTHVIQPNGVTDKESVTEIIPDALNGDADQLPELPLANDCKLSAQ